MRHRFTTKYGSRKTYCSAGHQHDSAKESRRCDELHLLQKLGMIKNLEQQPTFTLIEKYRWKGKAVRAMTYSADFRYFDKHTGKDTIEDTKGFKTEVYKIKKKLLLSILNEEEVDFIES